MKVLKVLFILFIIQFLLGPIAVSSETVYTKAAIENGEEIPAAEIKGKVTEITDDTVWVEIEKGDMIEEVGLDISSVSKIVTDDGKVYSSAIAYKQSEVKSSEIGE